MNPLKPTWAEITAPPMIMWNPLPNKNGDVFSNEVINRALEEWNNGTGINRNLRIEGDINLGNQGIRLNEGDQVYVTGNITFTGTRNNQNDLNVIPSGYTMGVDTGNSSTNFIGFTPSTWGG